MPVAPSPPKVVTINNASTHAVTPGGEAALVGPLGGGGPPVTHSSPSRPGPALPPLGLAKLQAWDPHPSLPTACPSPGDSEGGAGDAGAQIVISMKTDSLLQEPSRRACP